MLIYMDEIFYLNIKSLYISKRKKIIIPGTFFKIQYAMMFIFILLKYIFRVNV